MTGIELMQILHESSRRHGKKVFNLREMAALAQEPRPTTAMALLRAERKGLVARAGNLWLNRIDPPDLLAVALSVPVPSYLSFESALYRHGVVSQSPRGALTLATTGRPRLLQTALGDIRFIHLKSPLFFGFDSHRIASPEKAWLDLVYRRGLGGRENLFSEEIDLPRLNVRLLKRLAKSFPPWVSALAIDALHSQVRSQRSNAAGILGKAGFIACGKGSRDLSESTKKDLSAGLSIKHDHR